MNEKHKQINNRRAEAIFTFCNSLHDDIDSLYELMVDDTDEKEQNHIEYIIDRLKDLNLDRQ